MRYRISVDGRDFDVVVDHGGQVWVDGRLLDVDLQGVEDPARYSLLVDNRSYEAHLERSDGLECSIMISGHSYCARVHGGASKGPDGAQQADGAPQKEVVAPLPGLLATLRVTVGQRVEPGQVVAVLESMKMNLELRASSGGVVQAVCADQGCEVEQGQVLMMIGPDT